MSILKRPGESSGDNGALRQIMVATFGPPHTRAFIADAPPISASGTAGLTPGVGR